MTGSLPLFLSGGVVAGAAGAFGGVAGWPRFEGFDDEDILKTKLLGSFFCHRANFIDLGARRPKHATTDVCHSPAHDIRYKKLWEK